MNTSGSRDALAEGTIDELRGFVSGRIVERMLASTGKTRLLEISLESSPQTVEKTLRASRVAGFRAGAQGGAEASIPGWAWQLAEERELVVALDLAGELATFDRWQEVRESCIRHPQVQCLLSLGRYRGETAEMKDGLHGLRGLDRLWFDGSAACEPGLLVAVLREFGPRKLLWGAGLLPAPSGADDARLEPVRAMQEAADLFGLNEEDLEDILCDNALRLLGVRAEPGNRTLDLYRHAKQRIPGATGLFGKRIELKAPDQWPAYFREARGCEVWDLDGRHYYDFGANGVGSCPLGFRDPDVTRAVGRRINLGSMCSLNPPEEVELADLLCEIHPWAEQVRFARTGGETAAIAIRIARATTDRSVVAFCGYHGWHDWYLAANLGDTDALRGHHLPGLAPLGVPRELRGTSVTFRYNSRQEFQAVLDNYGDRLAAVIMEPCRYHDPEPGFLESVVEGAHARGALVIFDEITIGWRLYHGGSHLRFGVDPDMAIFGKAISNGHPLGAIIATQQAMKGFHGSFISSLYWTESVGPAAALVTVRKLKQVDFPAHAARVGARLVEFWQGRAEKHGLPVVAGDGYACVARFRFEGPQADELRTFYAQLMLERGFLAETLVYPTLAHTDEVVELYGAAVDEVFSEIAGALAAGDVKQRLKGPVAQTGFQRLL
jgi:glutamate-1-semialdehyde 2,1-aminomutase